MEAPQLTTSTRDGRWGSAAAGGDIDAAVDVAAYDT
jgi:hypothetical protein